MDGAKLEGTGFKCEVTEVTLPLLREVGLTNVQLFTLGYWVLYIQCVIMCPATVQVVDDFVSCGLFPRSAIPPPQT